MIRVLLGLIALVVVAILAAGCAFVQPSLSCTADAAPGALKEAKIRCTVSLDGVRQDLRVQTTTISPPEFGPSSQPSGYTSDDKDDDDDPDTNG